MKTVEELRDGSDFLAYEIWMMNATADWLQQPPADVLTRNVLVEDFLIHARALICFFYDEPRGDDIGANHFVQGWSRAIPDHLWDARGRINKEVAHLTYQRRHVRPNLKEHEINRIRDDLLGLAEDFRRLAAPKHLGDRFKALTFSPSAPRASVPDAVITTWSVTGTQ